MSHIIYNQKKKKKLILNSQFTKCFLTNYEFNFKCNLSFRSTKIYIRGLPFIPAMPPQGHIY